MSTTRPPSSKFTDRQPRRNWDEPTPLSDVLDEFPNVLKERKAALQTLTTYPCGVAVSHDKRTGCYRIHFDPKMPENEFKAFFAEKLKPLLIEKHQLQGGPEARFYYQPSTRDWEMRYRYHAKNSEGQDILKDGKPTWLSCHKQVQTIAQRVADRAAGLLSEKLGIAPKDAPIPD